MALVSGGVGVSSLFVMHLWFWNIHATALRPPRRRRRPRETRGTVCAARRPMNRVERQILIGWLNDAHAMEAQSLPVLRRQAIDPHHPLDVRERLESHVLETAQHAERLRQAIRALGSIP